MRTRPVNSTDVTLLAVLLVVAAIPASVVGQEALSKELQACAATKNDADRLTCYDGLVESADSQTEGTPQLTDEIGKESIKGGERLPMAEFSATVTRCEKSKASGRHFFYMENGQVWKQSNDHRRGWKDCRLAVTIRKDAFGYKMHVREENRSVRVTRVR